MEARKVLIYLALKFQGKWDEMYKEISLKREKISKETSEEIDKINLDAITIVDPDYPSFLKSIHNPPFVLFYKGNKELLDNRKYRHLAIVGSRKASMYGLDMVTNLLKELPKDVVIVSGLATGIDAKAHATALKNDYKTIAILGSGIDNCYPSENKELYDKIIEADGLILSEYPSFVEPEKDHFLIRNRIIAGLCKSLVLVESYTRSGAYNTACQAAGFGKNVACVPHMATMQSNCNKLIKEGAYLVENSNDVLDIL